MLLCAQPLFSEECVQILWSGLNVWSILPFPQESDCVRLSRSSY